MGTFLWVNNTHTLLKIIDHVKNYRPISLLSVISKIYEKHIYNELSLYVESNNILCCQQSGFRRNSSTNIAISKLLNQIVGGIEEKKLGLCVILDLKKEDNSPKFWNVIILILPCFTN